MKLYLPILMQEINDDKLVSVEKNVLFEIDTSVYSEERWEQNFPTLAAHEGLFQYIERIQETASYDRVKVACLLKAIYCFIESDEITSYKDFAKMFNLAAPEYTEKLITTLKKAFETILSGSSTKN